MEKTIYELDLHEGITVFGNISVLRVPGGWLYEVYNQATDDVKQVFVPYNNEFSTPNK